MNFINKINKFALIVVVLSVTSGCSVIRPDSSSKFEVGNDFVKTYEQVSPEEENVIGRAVSAKILGKYKIYNNPKLNDYLAKLGSILAAASDRPDPYTGYSFVVLDTDEVNAMAAPGGYIFITKGLLSKIKDEDSLASVIAHEISHVVKRHGIQSINPKNYGTFVEVGGVLLSAIDCSGLSQQMTLAFSRAVSDVLNRLLVSGYSKEQEYEADQTALLILNKAGYKSSSIKNVLNELSASKVKSGGWFSTHPTPEDRIAHIGNDLSDTASSHAGFAVRNARFLKNK
jgi:predicted Zn-dependent protease